MQSISTLLTECNYVGMRYFLLTGNMSSGPRLNRKVSQNADGSVGTLFSMLKQLG